MTRRTLAVLVCGLWCGCAGPPKDTGLQLPKSVADYQLAGITVVQMPTEAKEKGGTMAWRARYSGPYTMNLLVVRCATPANAFELAQTWRKLPQERSFDQGNLFIVASLPVRINPREALRFTQALQAELRVMVTRG